MTSGHQLRLYNSLGRRVEDFIPSGDVTGMYSCGPTVYVYPHLGNMRAYVFADTVRRTLRWKGIRVRHIVNITDVGHAVADADTGEDKMEVAAAREQTFNTPRLLAALQDALRDPEITPGGLRAVTAAADALLGLGLASLDPAELERRRSADDLNPEERHAIERLVADRTQVRKQRDWARADQIRAELDALGVQLTDTPEGPVWQLR